MHPIDEFFRQRLKDAGAEPPAELGRSILAHVQARKRRGLLWRKRILALLLLLIGGASGVLWMLRDPGQSAPAPIANSDSAGEAAPSGESNRPNVSHESGSLIESAVESPAPAPKNTTEMLTERVAVPLQGSLVRPADSPVHEGPSPTLPTTREVAIGSEDSAPESAPPGSAQPSIKPEAESAETGIARELLHPMEPTLAAAALPALDPWGPRVVRSERLRGQWWAALTGSAQASRYQWQSDHANLERALQGSGRYQGGWAIGALAGRSWPSGLSVGVGIEADRLDQSFRHVDRRTEEHTETVTHVVSLNTQVFTSTVETVTTPVVRESLAEGADRRVRLRVPVELAWTLQRGHWCFGARLGAVGEHATVRSSSSLALDHSDGLVHSRSLSQSELRSRYPLSLSGLAGFDIGFSVSDRARIMATPFASRSLATFGPGSDAQAHPERFGLRLMLQHRF